MDDAALLEQLQAGDAAAFEVLVRRYQATLTQVARYYVGSTSSAEDVVQETWIAVLTGVEGFEGRSAFKTWLFSILTNRARSIGIREHRSMPVDLQGDVPAVAAARFNEGGMWQAPPVPFDDLVVDNASDPGLVEIARGAIAELGEPGKTVVTLRDIEGLSTREVAEVLGISEGNVRVILHRTRSTIRGIIEERKGQTS